MPRPRFVLVKTGDTAPSIIDAHGDFDRMFLEKIEDLPIDVRTVQAHRGEPLPPISDVDAMIMTGSPASVTAREGWAEAAASWMSDLVDAQRPVLGVCYGHQLLAYARGGRVEVNPRGYEIGTVEIDLTAPGRQDALFDRLARPLSFNSVHTDAVTILPEEATVLATSDRTEVQAFSIGDRVWGVQFHPEITKPIMEKYLEARAHHLHADAKARGEDPDAAFAAVRSRIAETPHGKGLLRAFVSLALEKL